MLRGRGREGGGMTSGLYKLIDFTPPPQSDPVLSVWDGGGGGGGGEEGRGGGLGGHSSFPLVLVRAREVGTSYVRTISHLTSYAQLTAEVI